MWVNSEIVVKLYPWCDIGRDLKIRQWIHRGLEFAWSSRLWDWLSLTMVALELYFLFHKS